MERLTKRTAGGTAYINYPKSVCFDDGTEDGIAVAAHTQKVIEHLAAYEDTGLEPVEIVKMRGEVKTAYDESGIPYATEYTGYEARHITELVQAEHDGRLVVLPCKPDDTVWELDDRVSYFFCNGCQWYYSGGFFSNPFCKKTKDGRRPYECIEIMSVTFDLTPASLSLFTDSFGKTLFLTREEAETALAKRR